MRAWFRSQTYFTKQLLVVVGVNALSLGLATLLVYSSLVNDYRQNLVENTQSKLALLTSTSASALLFNDNETAQSILAALETSPSTRYAQIYDSDKRLFSEYRSAGVSPSFDVEQQPLGATFRGDDLYLFETIEQDNEAIGYIVMSADTTVLQANRERYLRILFLVFLLSLLLAYTVNWRLQKVLNAPIKQMVNLVTEVAKHNRFERRLNTNRQDELGHLMRGVDTMLDTIEEHRDQLQRHSDKLENLVAVRTEQLFQRANYDALTQLPNRHLLIDRLDHGIANAEREGSEMALMFLDLDRFKVINDSLGHSVGDDLLIKVAQILSAHLRKSDSVCRWGGDEFVILLEHLHQQQEIETLAKGIIAKLQTPLQVAGHQLHVSTSIGIARYPSDGANSGTLLKHADISMYQAKQQGPGRFAFFDESMLGLTAHRLSLENDLRQALEQNAFSLVYQPQICLETGRMQGLEALLRWNNNGSMISPADFIPLAEEIGLIQDLTLWVVAEACRQNATWKAAGLDVVKVAVNVPASIVANPRQIDAIIDTLQESGLPAELLEVEITENAFIESVEHAIHSLKRLKDLGTSVAIDDFGTGYSCMSYLRDLPIDTLKIDGSFILNMDDTRASQGIIHSIITLGKNLDLLLIGECVENAQHAKQLGEMGCDMAQGYHFSRPLNAAEMTAYLTRFTKGLL